MPKDGETSDVTESLSETHKRFVRKRATLRTLFTKEDRRVDAIINSEEPDLKTLFVVKDKLVNAKHRLQEYDDKIQDLLIQLKEDQSAEYDFEECDIISDNHSLLLARVADFIQSLEKVSQLSSSAATKSAKHSSVKLPKIVLPTFDGDQRKWFSFWDVFESEIHSCKDISDVTKFNYLKGQLSSSVKKRIEGIQASNDNYLLLVQTLQDNYGNRTLIKNSHCLALVNILKPQYNASSLRAFYDAVIGDIRSLETLELLPDRYGEFYVPILMEKLPTDVLTTVLETYTDENPLLMELMDIIHSEVKKLEQINTISQQKVKTVSSKPTTVVKPDTLPSGSATAMPTTSSTQSSRSFKTKLFKRPARLCQFCGGQHNTFQCTLSVDDRVKVVKSHKWCMNCLKDSHAIEYCPSQWRCSICKESHHTAIHGSNLLQSASALGKSQRTTPSTQTGLTNAAFTGTESLADTLTSDVSSSQPQIDSYKLPELQSCLDPVILKTAVAPVKNGQTTLETNFFFDEGSTLTYIKSQHARNLKLVPYGKRRIVIDSFGGRSALYEFPVGSIDVLTDDGVINLEVLFKDQIVQPISCNTWSDCLQKDHLKELRLANQFDQLYFDVHILIGLDSVWKFLKPEIILGFPLVQASSLGYLVYGPVNNQVSTADGTATQCLMVESSGHDDVEWIPTDHTDFELHDKVAKSLQIESLGIEPFDDKTDSEFLERFINQIEYRNGTYYAPLPWLDNQPTLQSNLSIALSRLEQVKNRLLKLQLWGPYSRIIQDQLEKNYVESVPDEVPWKESGAHYLSHFFVLRPESETTPLRVVYAANAGRTSLNDCLHTGPCLLQPLFELLQRFRLNRYALVADIEKAFLRIKLFEPDRDYVRFLWYTDGDPIKPIKVYRYTSVFFGGKSSPFILNSTVIYHLSKYAEDPDNFKSQVAADLKNKLYCDNVLSGQDDEDTAIQYYHSARQIMSEADMNLRQWSTNLESLQNIIKQDGTGSTKEYTSLLGMVWNHNEDTITFPKKTILPSSQDKFTKRSALSSASSTFDPLGFLTPVTVRAKNFISELWKQNYEWDTPLPTYLHLEYHDIASNIEAASAIRLQRFIDLDKDKPIQLHTFCDASPNVAAACVLYLRQEDQVWLIASKFKTASSKRQYTVPRWELVAMLIGSRLSRSLMNIISKDFKMVEQFYWTDSSICLSWLSSTKKLDIFVRNRLDEIQRLTDVRKWNHVRSEDNPADLPSRGCTADQLIESRLWFSGPDWLPYPEKWRESVVGKNDKTESLGNIDEINSNGYITCTSTAASTGGPSNGTLSQLLDVSRYSSYERLLRTMAYVQRFIQNLKQRHLVTNKHQDTTLRIIPVPSAEEVQRAEFSILRAHQKECFPTEIAYLLKKSDSTKTRPQLVRQLCLRLNWCNLIVAPGRLEHAQLDKDAKLPVLISRKTILTELLVKSVHSCQLHAGVSSTVTALRRRFWLPAARSEVSRVLRRCVTCRYHVGKPFRLPPSPALPDFRLNRLKPYSTVGIDFTGHLIVKNGVKKVQKCYICLFTCSTTRNVNLEVVTDMSTDQFLQAFRRHTAIYGIPSLILCDNAATFVKADEEITKLFNGLDEPAVQNHLANNKVIYMKHIPAKSPHWGGMYERLIGVVKMVIKKVLRRALIDLNEMQTLVKEVQSVVNDRPLTYVSTSAEDPEPITPSKLLYGYDITTLPHPGIESDGDEDYRLHDGLNKAMRHRAEVFHHFVNRFRSEYLSTLRERHTYQLKKTKARTNLIKIGDVVLVHDKDRPRCLWKLALVRDLIRGTDGFVRAASIKTKNGVTNRSIHLLYPLEVSLSEPKEFFKDINSSIPQVDTVPLRRSKRLAVRPRPKFVESSESDSN